MSFKIFISYRREDTAATAGRIREGLISDFGARNIFMDVDSIPIGVNFEEHLDKTLDRCLVVLLLIGKQWLFLTDTDGNRRLDQQGDYIRTEVNRAIDKRIKIIPILIDGASMPKELELPDNIRALAKINAIDLRNANFIWDIKKLKVELIKTVGVDPRKTRVWRTAIVSLAAIILAVAYFAIIRGWFGLTPYSSWTPNGFVTNDFRVQANQDPPPCDLGNSAPTEAVPIYWRGEANLALLKQAIAKSSSTIPGFETRHQVDYLNDGWYNNCRSWVPSNMPAWIEVDLGEVFEVNRIALGSEHTRYWGDRRILKFNVSIWEENERRWKKIIEHDDRSSPIDTTTSFVFDPELTRIVRVDFESTVNNDNVRIDEIEIYGRRSAK